MGTSFLSLVVGTALTLLSSSMLSWPPNSWPGLGPLQTARAAGVWNHPVDAPVVDFFRPPSNPYGPGNRGLEYDTFAGQPVAAVAAGSVVFAGQVGGTLFVVVAHDPRLRSTYAYLDQMMVGAGDTVEQGQQLATALPGFHLTARINGRYVDPLAFMVLRWSVRLVPIDRGLRRSNTPVVGPR